MGVTLLTSTSQGPGQGLRADGGWKPSGPLQGENADSCLDHPFHGRELNLQEMLLRGSWGGGRVPEMRATSAPNMVSVLQEGPGPATCSDHHVITVMDGKRPGQADPQGQRVGSWLSGLGEGRGRITDNGDGLPLG